jgi:hypothetical protein
MYTTLLQLTRHGSECAMSTPTKLLATRRTALTARLPVQRRESSIWRGLQCRLPDLFAAPNSTTQPTAFQCVDEACPITTNSRQRPLVCHEYMRSSYIRKHTFTILNRATLAIPRVVSPYSLPHTPYLPHTSYPSIPQ